MKKTYTLILVILLTLTLSACGLLQGSLEDGDNSKNNILDVDREGNSIVDEESLDSLLENYQVTALTQDEQAGLKFMVEEEKLARDVYTFLFEEWKVNSFENIAKSEHSHMQAIRSLIMKYNLEDPSVNDPGVFANQSLKVLHDQLTDQGQLSDIDALKVGATIEEIDIIDLQEYLSLTDKEAIKTVYENLLKGSRNHLRAFVSRLSIKGVKYQPVYLDAAEYKIIIEGTMERGRN